MVGEPSHVKQLSLNHVCKIGLISTVRFASIFLRCRLSRVRLRFDLYNFWNKQGSFRIDIKNLPRSKLRFASFRYRWHCYYPTIPLLGRSNLVRRYLQKLLHNFRNAYIYGSTLFRMPVIGTGRCFLQCRPLIEVDDKFNLIKNNKSFKKKFTSAHTESTNLL